MQSAAAVHRDALATPAGEPLFSSAHAALTFAFNHTAQVYDRPLMARLASKPRPGTGKGLGGTDGAGQAGMILAKMDQLTELHQLIILARFLPQTACCSHCGSDAWDADWLAVIRKISDAAMLHGVLSGHIIHRAVRDALVMRYFANKANRKRILLGTIAAKAGISDRTVTDQNSKIVLWLKGSRFTKAGKGQLAAGQKGEDARAMERVEAALVAAGMIGTDED